MHKAVTHSGFRMTQGQEASGMSVLYPPWCLPGNVHTDQCVKDRAGGEVPAAAASLAKKGFGEIKDSWVANSKALPWRLSFVNTSHAKQQLEGALGIPFCRENNSLFFTINNGPFSGTELYSWNLSSVSLFSFSRVLGLYSTAYKRKA